MVREEYTGPNGQVCVNRIIEDLNYYRGFYDGVREITGPFDETNIDLDEKEIKRFLKIMKKIGEK